MNTKKYTYKLQGNGLDSWEVEEISNSGILISKYMIFDNPNSQPKVDLTLIINQATSEEIALIKTKLDI